jgi:hypothetical protein
MTPKQLVDIINIFINEKVKEYQKQNYGYKKVTYNIGYVDALLTVQKFIEDIKK